MAQEKESKKDFTVIGKDLKANQAVARPSLTYWQDAWRRFRENKLAVISLIFLGLVILYAIIGSWIFPDYKSQSLMNTYQPPGKEFWFGTDELGRDLFARLIRGTKISLFIGLIVSVINMVIGIIFGGICGYYGGKLDMVVMRIVDILYGIPSLIVTILVMVVIGRGITTLIIAMCIVGWIGTCRFVRGEVYRLKNQDFVLAAKVLGVRNISIIIRHIIPNIMGLLVTNLCMAIPGAIFQEAFLSYIGLGITPPNCSWGILAKEGVKMLRVAPHEVLIPAFFICTTMLALNLLGDGLRDALDPRLRGSEG